MNVYLGHMVALIYVTAQLKAVYAYVTMIAHEEFFALAELTGSIFIIAILLANTDILPTLFASGHCSCMKHLQQLFLLIYVQSFKPIGRITSLCMI